MSDPVYLFLFAVSTLCAVVGTVTGVLGLVRAKTALSENRMLRSHLLRQGVIGDSDDIYPEPPIER